MEPDGTRHRIDDVEGLLGPRLGAGDFKTAFAFGDKAVLVVRSAKHDETMISGFKEMAMLNQLDEAGLPVARPLGLIRVGGRPALLVDRYVASSKDMLDRTGDERRRHLPPEREQPVRACSGSGWRCRCGRSTSGMSSSW